MTDAKEVDGCQYIGGAERACGEPVLPRTSYCEAHHARIFMKASDRVPVAFQLNPAKKGAASDYARRVAMGREQGGDDGQR